MNNQTIILFHLILLQIYTQAPWTRKYNIVRNIYWSYINRTLPLNYSLQCEATEMQNLRISSNMLFCSGLFSEARRQSVFRYFITRSRIVPNSFLDSVNVVGSIIPWPSYHGEYFKMCMLAVQFPVSLLDVVNCMWSFSFKMSVSFYHLLCYVGLAIVQKLDVF